MFSWKYSEPAKVVEEEPQLKEKTYEAKCVLLGDANVGKTSICRQYVNGEFEKEQKPTIARKLTY